MNMARERGVGANLDELDHILLLLLLAPFLKGIDVGEGKGIAVVRVARAVWLF